jgi:site-specific recombinase XerD
MTRRREQRPRETLETVSVSFARHLRAEGKSENTIDVYMDSIKSLIQYRATTTFAEDVTSEDIEEWLTSLREKGNKPNTIVTRRRAVLGLYGWLLREGDVTENPVTGTAPPRIPDSPQPVLTEDQQRALLEATRGTSFDARRDTAVLRLFMATGIRRGEMAAIRLADIDMDREMVTVTGKGGNTRSVTFGRRAAQALDRYIRLRAVHRYAASPSLWLGTRGPLREYGIEELVRRAGIEAGIPWLHPHVFRHTWAAGALALGLHEQDVSALAGWRSPTMVTRYGRAVRAERAQASHRANNPGDQI